MKLHKLSKTIITFLCNLHIHVNVKTYINTWTKRQVCLDCGAVKVVYYNNDLL